MRLDQNEQATSCSCPAPQETQTPSNLPVKPSATLFSCCTTASRRSLRRANTVTIAPLSLSPSATARPMPAEPPAIAL